MIFLLLLIYFTPVDKLHPTVGTLDCWNGVLDAGACGDQYGDAPSWQRACMQLVANSCVYYSGEIYR